MAKRKRLILDLAEPAAPDFPGDPRDGRAPEVKAHLPAGFAPPIAQVAGDASATAALADLAASVAAARADGRLLQRLALGTIDTDHLVRDRLAADDEELAGLAESIRAHGQRTPIEVADLGTGRYGLISGWRRVTALTRLAAEDASGDAAFGTVLAMVRRPAHAAEAYVAMVEENEIRAGLSYWERARIAARAADLGVFASEREALRRLFANASRSRRSKIGSFLGIYRVLDGVLRFPAALGERLGLDLAQALEEGRVTPERIATALRIADPQTPGSEQAVLAIQLARPAPGSAPAAGPDIGPDPGPAAPRNVSRAKHSPAPKPPAPSPPADSTQAELRPGVILTVTGFVNPTLTLSGPAVDQTFRERLAAWVITGR